ncbi:transketolase [Nitrospirillum sp. BR 11828]|uniref:transketolase n=1 Tax=Nitrospirillum sp. BR 11828 TaxID=3104325 RepID=UPI002ACA96EA|nr:transketolase [Nitrospirillum sp. BR 11828]MDZ5647536.1 transketolase [Nitrospirillum sp. BR 11828]
MSSQPATGDVVGGVPHKDLATAIRVLAMDAVEAAKSGHPGMPMGMADVATVLFTQFLKFDPKRPDWADRDRFVLSAGHGSMLIYALLYLTGYEDIDLEQIKKFRQLGARTAGHPEYGMARGIEMTTGPLGQGIATAVGMALAERHLNARFGDALVDHHTYVIAGDGCLQEGVSHEAASLAGHLGLDRLIVLWDDNSISIDGPTNLSLSEDVKARFVAYGWDVQAVDGHDPAAVAAAIAQAKTTSTPSLIACRTTIGLGAPTKAGKNSSHGSPLGAAEIAGARAAYGWEYGPFEIPAPILDAWRQYGARGATAASAWDQRLAAADNGLVAAFKAAQSGDAPAALDATITAFKRATSEARPSVATRQASGNVLDAIFDVVPELMSGSADLTGSNNTRTKGVVSLQRDKYEGRYIHYGVREHAMAAAMNGMALHGGVIPLSGTFLCFADYSRPAIRLGALMKQRVVHVMTHDSIGLGEDGPTHQPVEHMAALRAIPNLLVFRPADQVETAECWQLALRSKTRPSVLALTRQNLATLRTEHTDDNLTAKGAYVLREADGAAAKVVLLATGSEVEIAVQARDVLQAEGVPTRVVSMPSWELFVEQGEAYQAQVLGGDDVVRVGVEAMVRMGWDRWIGPKGGFVGMPGFGESGPYKELYAHFGITVDGVVAAAKARL